VRRRIALGFVAVVLAGWNAALWAAPVANATTASALTYLAGSLVCHQKPERSFHRDGAQFPVCARCEGLYAGALAGVIGWVIFAGAGGAAAARTERVLKRDTVRAALSVVAIPTMLTLALAWLGVWDASNTWRAALAIPLGAAIAAVVAAVAAGDLR
jgi:uncharacterized membrane protein